MAILISDKVYTEILKKVNSWWQRASDQEDITTLTMHKINSTTSKKNVIKTDRNERRNGQIQNYSCIF